MASLHPFTRLLLVCEREAKTMASHPDYFFVDSSGNQYGPVAAEVIKQYWNGGYVNEETFCFAADGRLATWTPLKDVKALYELCVPPRVPQAPSLVARPVLAAPVLHVAEVAKQLEMCVAVLHHEALKLALASVGSKGEEHFASYGELLQAARALDANLDAVRAELKAGISCSDLKQLERAIERSRHLGLSHYELPAAVHHAHRMRALIKMARLALTTLEDAPLAAVVAEADQLHFVCDEVSAIKALLALPPEKKLSEQLRMAVKLGDAKRTDQLQMQLKDLFFERTGAALFDITKFPRLRSAGDFANAKMGLPKQKKDRRDGVLQHTTNQLQRA
jgi:hypothetical protein